MNSNFVDRDQCATTKPNCYQINKYHHHTTTVLRPFFRDHPGEPVPEENIWTLWCKGRLTEADTLTIRLGATPSGLVNQCLPHHPPIFFTGRMPFLPPNQQRQSTEGNYHIRIREKTLEFSSTVLPAPSPYHNQINKYYYIKRLFINHCLQKTSCFMYSSSFLRQCRHKTAGCKEVYAIST